MSDIAKAIYETVDVIRSFRAQNKVPENKVIDIYLELNEIGKIAFIYHRDRELNLRVLNGMAKVNSCIKIDDNWYELKK